MFHTTELKKGLKIELEGKVFVILKSDPNSFKVAKVDGLELESYVNL